MALLDLIAGQSKLTESLKDGKLPEVKVVISVDKTTVAEIALAFLLTGILLRVFARLIQSKT